MICHAHPRHGGSKDHPILWAVRNELAGKRGFATLGFNFRGNMGIGRHVRRRPRRDPRRRAPRSSACAEAPIGPTLSCGWSFGANVALREALDDERVGRPGVVGLPIDRTTSMLPAEAVPIGAPAPQAGAVPRGRRTTSTAPPMSSVLPRGSSPTVESITRGHRPLPLAPGTEAAAIVGDLRRTACSRHRVEWLRYSAIEASRRPPSARHDLFELGPDEGHPPPWRRKILRVEPTVIGRGRDGEDMLVRPIDALDPGAVGLQLLDRHIGRDHGPQV